MGMWGGTNSRLGEDEKSQHERWNKGGWPFKELKED